MGSSHGYSLCYDQEGDSYYKPANLGTFKDPQWEYLLNDDFQQVSWIDIPHDGLGQFDKYDVMCGDKDHNGSLDSDAYYCSGDDINYLGITEEYKIMNVNNAGIPWDENNIADCTQAPYNEQPGICDEFLTDNIEILDLVSDDENWVHTNATQDGNADVNGDGILDLEAYFYDSDEDVGYNYRQPNHDIDVDGSDQYANGGYDFNNNKYGYYNAYGNYEKGSGDDRKFTDELEEMIYNMGFEYQYSETFIMRFGFIYDLEGEVKNPTFGAGLKFDKYGFDFGYTAGNDDDARSETMFLSISLGL